MDKKRMKLIAFYMAVAVILIATLKYPEAGVAAVTAAFLLIGELIGGAGAP